MASDALDTRPWRRPRAMIAPPAAMPALAAMLTVLALAALNPVGYIGGGDDDYQYLSAARCLARHGFCLPHDHWWRRWPIVVPTATMLRLFGESYVTLALVPLGYALGSVALFAVQVARIAGRAAGTIAGVTLAATPIMSELALDIGIDLPEFLFVLAAVAILERGWARGGSRYAAAAGLAAGLAIQARPTALTLVPLALLLFAGTRRWRWAAAFVVAASLPSLVEAAVYALAAGDPLLGWRLSLAHGRIPSSELLASVDTTRSPLFNPAFIGGWVRPMDIHVHWSVDGVLNWLFHPAVALTLIAALTLLLLDGRALIRGKGAALLGCALLLGVGWFAALTYGFAVDPKPRMFLPTLAAACAVIGVTIDRRWRSGRGRALAIAVLVLIVGKGVVAAYERPSLVRSAAAAPAMIAAAGPGLSIEARTARFLTLVPAARALPLSHGAADPRRVLVLGLGSCAEAAAEQGYAGRRTLARFTVPRAEPEPLPTLRAHRLFLGTPSRPVLCVMAPPA